MAKYRRRPPLVDHYGPSGTRRMVPVPFGKKADAAPGNNPDALTLPTPPAAPPVLPAQDALPPSQRDTLKLDINTRSTRQSTLVVAATSAGRDATPTQQVTPLPPPIRRVSLEKRFYNVTGFRLDDTLVATAFGIMVLLGGLAVHQIYSQLR